MADNFNVWERYGLSDNPLQPDPLLVLGGNLPIDRSFIGREIEIRRINTLIYSNSTTRILVHGKMGIGKTTFINYIRHLATKHKAFTPLGEINIQYTWEPEMFMFATIQSMFATISKTDIAKKMNAELMEKLKVYFGYHRGGTMGVGLSTGIVGGNIVRAQTFGARDLNAYELKDILTDFVQELKRLGFERVIIHYNNLELALEKDGNNLPRIFNGIREFMQVDGVHFIFVGDQQVFQIIERLPRIRDTFQPDILIKSLSLEEIEQIIRKRIEILKIENYKVSIDDIFETECMKMLYKLYNGDLRAILLSLSTAIYEIAGDEPKLLTVKLMENTLKKRAEGRFMDDKNNVNRRVLLEILKKGEMNNKQLSLVLSQRPQNITAALNALKNKDAIYLAYEDGRERYYSPTREAKWLLLEN